MKGLWVVYKDNMGGRIQERFFVNIMHEVLYNRDKEKHEAN